MKNTRKTVYKTKNNHFILSFTRHAIFKIKNQFEHSFQGGRERTNCLEKKATTTNFHQFHIHTTRKRVKEKSYKTRAQKI